MQLFLLEHFIEFNSYFLPRKMATRIMITITAIVNPIQTPAEKISPIAWHELKVTRHIASSKDHRFLIIFKIYFGEVIKNTLNYFNIII